jgi:alpha-1,2-glucosyltransferase
MANSILIICLVILNLIIANRFNKSLTGPYMDEEFHFDQFIHYAQDDYTYWNDKLTTFPGLFYISSWLFFIFSGIIGTDALSFLRLINSLYGVGTTWISRKFDHMNSKENNLLFQLIITLLPINYFFNFLYYTDSLSIMLVFSFYYGVERLKKKYSFIVYLV